MNIDFRYLYYIVINDQRSVLKLSKRIGLDVRGVIIKPNLNTEVHSLGAAEHK